MSDSGKLKVTVMTVDRTVYEGEADSVTGFGIGGEFTILSKHVAYMTPLEIGVLTIRVAGREEDIALHAGFLRVEEDDVTILADAAEKAQDINIQRAKAAKQRAEDMLKRLGEKQPELDDSGAALRRALLRLRVAGRS